MEHFILHGMMSDENFQEKSTLVNNNDLKFVQVHRNDGKSSLVFKILRNVAQIGEGSCDLSTSTDNADLNSNDLPNSAVAEFSLDSTEIIDMDSKVSPNTSITEFPPDFNPNMDITVLLNSTAKVSSDFKDSTGPDSNDFTVTTIKESPDFRSSNNPNSNELPSITMSELSLDSAYILDSDSKGLPDTPTIEISHVSSINNNLDIIPLLNTTIKASPSNSGVNTDPELNEFVIATIKKSPDSRDHTNLDSNEFSSTVLKESPDSRCEANRNSNELTINAIKASSLGSRDSNDLDSYMIPVSLIKKSPDSRYSIPSNSYELPVTNIKEAACFSRNCTDPELTTNESIPPNFLEESKLLFQLTHQNDSELPGSNDDSIDNKMSFTPRNFCKTEDINLRRSLRIRELLAKSKIQSVSSFENKKKLVRSGVKGRKKMKSIKQKRPPIEGLLPSKPLNALNTRKMRLRSIFLRPTSPILPITSDINYVSTSSKINLPKFANVDPSQALSFLDQQQVTSSLESKKPILLIFTRDFELGQSSRSFQRSHNASANNNLLRKYYFKKIRNDALSFSKKYHRLNITTLDACYSKCLAYKT